MSPTSAPLPATLRILPETSFGACTSLNELCQTASLCWRSLERGNRAYWENFLYVYLLRSPLRSFLLAESYTSHAAVDLKSERLSGPFSWAINRPEPPRAGHARRARKYKGNRHTDGNSSRGHRES